MTSESQPESASGPVSGPEPAKTSGLPGPAKASGSGKAAGSAVGANAPAYADRCYRSPAGMAGGVVLLALGAWLGADAVLRGSGRTPWVALAGLVLMFPLVIAFTLRPAVYAGETRMRVRNPFRTVTVPWGEVESLQAGYSSELVAAGAKYQLWAVPVSLRARNRATRHNDRVASGRPPAGGGFMGFGGAPAVGEPDMSERRAHADVVMAELRELRARHGESAPATGPVRVRWAWEILVPLAAGALGLAALWATG